jgi:hypothetical protein
MFFLNPIFLWTLLGLSVPLAIHLWSKKKGKRIKVGSIKFLQEIDSKKSKSIALNEIILLLLRILLLSVLAFIIAEPRLDDKVENTAITYIIEPSLLNFSEVKTLVDSLEAETDVRLLEHGFPSYDTRFTIDSFSETPHYWQLSRELEDLTTDSIVVFTQAFYKGVKGKRPQLSTSINWVNLDVKKPEQRRLALLQTDDEIELISVWSDANELNYIKELYSENKELEDFIPVFSKQLLKLNFFTDDEFYAEEKYLKSAFSAISKYLNQPVEIKNLEAEGDVSSDEVLIWLSTNPTPAFEGQLLKFKSDVPANSLIEKAEVDNEFYLTSKLNSENIIEEHLAEELISFLNLNSDVEKEAEKYDIRVMDLDVLKPKLDKSLKPEVVKAGRDVSPYFWLVFFVLLISERLVSKYRKQ